MRIVRADTAFKNMLGTVTTRGEQEFIDGGVCVRRPRVGLRTGGRLALVRSVDIAEMSNFSGLMVVFNNPYGVVGVYRPILE
jgi:hypothetical protein